MFPGGTNARAVVVMVRVDWADVVLGVTLVGLKAQLAPAGRPEHARVIGLLKAPPLAVTVAVNVADCPAVTVAEPGEEPTEKFVTMT